MAADSTQKKWNAFFDIHLMFSIHVVKIKYVIQSVVIIYVVLHVSNG